MSAVLDSCTEVLADFDEPTKNLPGKDGTFLPYMLDEEQVGAVHLLLWKAKKLEKENLALNEMLDSAQGLIDCSIANLDPDRE